MSLKAPFMVTSWYASESFCDRMWVSSVLELLLEMGRKLHISLHVSSSALSNITKEFSSSPSFPTVSSFVSVQLYKCEIQQNSKFNTSVQLPLSYTPTVRLISSTVPSSLPAALTLPSAYYKRKDERAHTGNFQICKLSLSPN